MHGGVDMHAMAGVVTFNPDLESLQHNLKCLKKVVQSIVVIDNDSNKKDMVCLLCEKLEIQYIQNDRNMGISKALNQMMNYAKVNGYDWVLSLDQDTVVPENILFDYRKLFKKLESAKIGMFCPAVIEKNTKKNVVRGKGEYSYVKRCITSATMTNVEAWIEVGGYDEQLFIDYVDYDFCAKIRKRDYYIIQSNSTFIEHELGESELRYFLFFKVRVSNYSSFRKYYITRNLLVYIKRHCSFVEGIIEYIRLFRFILYTILYEKNKKEKMQAIKKGIRDSLKLD